MLYMVKACGYSCQHCLEACWHRWIRWIRWIRCSLM